MLALVATAVGWPDVAIALIVALPGLVAAYASLSNRKALKTPSGKSIGQQVEGTLHNTFGTNYRVQAMQQSMAVPTPAGAAAHEQSAERANGLTEPPAPAPPTTLAPPPPPEA